MRDPFEPWVPVVGQRVRVRLDVTCEAGWHRLEQAGCVGEVVETEWRWSRPDRHWYGVVFGPRSPAVDPSYFAADELEPS